MHIFISYARIDEPFARQLASALSQMNADVWLDVDDIPAGMNWSSAIQQGLDNCDLMLVIMSPESMASRNVENEWQWFIDERKPIIPILWREARSHFQLRRLQYINFKDQPFNEAFQELQGEIARAVEVPNESVSPPPPLDVPTPEPLLIAKPASPQPAVTSQTPSPQPAKPAVRTRNPLSNIPRRWLVGGTVAVLAVALIALVVVPALNPYNDNQQSLEDLTDPLKTMAVEQTATRIARTQAKDDELATTTAVLAITGAVETQVNLDQAATNEALATVTNAAKTQAAAGLPTNTPVPISSIPSVTTNADWAAAYMTFDGFEMALVPSGCFLMGSKDGAEDQKPVIEQCFDQPFWIDRYEVTNKQFGSTGKFTGDFQPRDSVTWSDARDFCAVRQARLPTEREWEYAARGPDNLAYPWGNEFVDEYAVHVSNSNEESAEVGSVLAGNSWVGASDMSGNLWEWVSSLYLPYQSADDRENPDVGSGVRVIRGGSWGLDSSVLSATYRGSSVDPYEVNNEYGFRCVRDYAAEAEISLTTPIRSNADWRPFYRMIDGFEMALVPMGCFTMGQDGGEEDQAPAKGQCVDQPFWIDRYEVTNAQFGSTGHFTDDNQPRDSVSWFEAREFCNARDYTRLPTELEWEYIARGPDSLIYPWGNSYVADNVVSVENAGDTTAPVGSRPQGNSWVGAADMSGNLLEWVSSRYMGYPYASGDGREVISEDTDISRVLRGGSYKDNSNQSALRFDDYPMNAYVNFGFRCMRIY